MSKNQGPQGPTSRSNPISPTTPTDVPGLEPDEPSYTASSLAAAAGISTRTVHYYRNEGLLPPPEGRGKGAHYGEDHLERLRVIRDASRSHLPLSEIRSILNSEPDASSTLDVLNAIEGGSGVSLETSLLPDAMRELAEGVVHGFIDTDADFDGGRLRSTQTRNSAADYAASVLGAMQGRIGSPPCPTCGSIMVNNKCLNCGSSSGLLRGVRVPSPPIGWTAPAPLPTDVPGYKYPPLSPLRSVVAGSLTTGRTTVGASPKTHSTWERIPLCADIEIHVQRPTSRTGNRALARIIEAAMAIVEEEKLS